MINAPPVENFWLCHWPIVRLHMRQHHCNCKTNIHRHQIPPRYRHDIHRHCRTVEPPPFNVAPTTAKCDVIHKTRSTQRNATPPAEDRATNTGDLHRKFCANRSSGSRDMLADRQTHTDRQIDHNTLHPYLGRVTI